MPLHVIYLAPGEKRKDLNLICKWEQLKVYPQLHLTLRGTYLFKSSLNQHWMWHLVAILNCLRIWLNITSFTVSILIMQTKSNIWYDTCKVRAVQTFYSLTNKGIVSFYQARCYGNVQYNDIIMFVFFRVKIHWTYIISLEYNTIFTIM